MNCPNCKTAYSTDDSYCRHCGRVLNRPALPVIVERSDLPARRPTVDLEVSPGERALAVGGAATLGASVLVWLARRWLLPRLAQTADENFPSHRRRRSPEHRPKGDPDVLPAAKVETFIWIHRIILRR
jgi:hypothetical protein